MTPEPVSRSFQKARKSTKNKNKKKVKKQSKKRRKSRKSKTRKSRSRGPPSKGGSSTNVFLNFGDSIPRNSSEHVVDNDPIEAGGDKIGGGSDGVPVKIEKQDDEYDAGDTGNFRTPKIEKQLFVTSTYGGPRLAGSVENNNSSSTESRDDAISTVFPGGRMRESPHVNAKTTEFFRNLY
jgi:hypothetical protein